MAYQLKAAVLAKTKRIPEALAALEKGHDIAPKNIDLLVDKAQLQLAQANYQAAAEELSRALAIEGSRLTLLELRAALYQQLGQKAKALADLTKILELKPHQPNVMRSRALLLAESGQYDAAVNELEELHKLNPLDSLTLLQIGRLYLVMKKYDKAVNVFTDVLTDHPDDTDAMGGRADAYLNLGQRASAAADYEHALQRQPHDVTFLNNFAWLLATAPEGNLRDARRAVVLATDACRQTDYKQDFILSTLAAAYAEQGDFEAAKKWAAAAVEVSPSDKAEPSRKEELKKELESYKANKPWREALPEGSKKAKSPDKKTEKTTKSRDGSTSAK